MCKVLNINDYSYSNEKFRSKTEVVDFMDLLHSKDKKIEMFARRMYNNSTKMELNNKLKVK